MDPLVQLQWASNVWGFELSRKVCEEQTRELELTCQGLTKLPQGVSQLTCLRALNLSRNELSTLPDFICDLPKLKVLNLEENCLTALPTSIGNLSCLKKLIVGRGGWDDDKEASNYLTALPDSVGSLTSLIALSVNFNSLQSLPESVSGTPFYPQSP
eukprot:147103-Rhodomonas_salina.1